MGVVFPVSYDTAPCYLVAINRELIPFVAGMLQIMEKRGFWASETDYERGYNAVLGLEGCLMAACLDDFIRLQEAQYRLLSTAFIGTEYSADASDPPIISPAIPDYITVGDYERDSALGMLNDNLQLIDNSINGTETPHYDYTPSVKELLQTVIDTLGADDAELADILAQLEIIAGLVA